MDNAMTGSTSPPVIPNAPTRDATSAQLAVGEGRAMADAINAISARLQRVEGNGTARADSTRADDNGNGDVKALLTQILALLKNGNGRGDNGNGADGGDGSADAATGEEGISNSGQTSEEEKGHATEQVGGGGATYDTTRPRRMASDSARADSVAAALEDDARVGEAQHRYDEVLSLHGRRADRPRIAERSSVYRRRVLRQLCDLSPRHRGINPHLVSDPKAFDELEAAILEGARQEAYNPLSVADGVMREVREREPRTGREVIKFVGGFRTAMAPFIAPTYRVKKINRRPDEY
jgi:hypothetical protein